MNLLYKILYNFYIFFESVHYLLVQIICTLIVVFAYIHHKLTRRVIRVGEQVCKQW